MGVKISGFQEAISRILCVDIYSRSSRMARNQLLEQVTTSTSGRLSITAEGLKKSRTQSFQNGSKLAMSLVPVGFGSRCRMSIKKSAAQRPRTELKVDYPDLVYRPAINVLSPFAE
jgi:hypothetical protein